MIQFLMPAPLHLDDHRDRVVRFSVWITCNRIDVDIRSLSEAKASAATNFDLAIHYHPSLFEIFIEVDFDVIRERIFILRAPSILTDDLVPKKLRGRCFPLEPGLQPF